MNYCAQIIWKDCLRFQTAQLPRITAHHFTCASWDNQCFKYGCSSVSLNELHVCISGQLWQNVSFIGKRGCLQAGMDLIALPRCLAQQPSFLCVHSCAQPAQTQIQTQSSRLRHPPGSERAQAKSCLLKTELTTQVSKRDQPPLL